jgi:hypothetical protein
MILWTRGYKQTGITDVRAGVPARSQAFNRKHAIGLRSQHAGIPSLGMARLDWLQQGPPELTWIMSTGNERTSPK